MRTILSILLPLVIIAGVTCDSFVSLQTKLGPISGLSSSVNINNVTKYYTVFKKVPFAKPPVGDLRFRQPVLHGPWNGTLDATSFGPSCIQQFDPQAKQYLPNLNQSEDCLHLNIYAPYGASTSNRKSVMIWVHGGGYVDGQGMAYDGTYLSVTGDVIVVTINYRLNIFGFFATSDGLASGNYGLWDQKLAIQWVNENIESFGGDSDSITIFGESAGGFSVALHATIPANRGLFRRVIEQSGTSNSFFSTTPVPHKASDEVARVLNCSHKFTTDIMACMRDKHSDDVYNAMQGFISGMTDGPDFHIVGYFAPVVDGILIKENPRKVIANHNSSAYGFFKSLDVMVGTCESEGSLLVGYLSSLQKYLPFNISEGISSEFLCKHILHPLASDYYNNDTTIAEAICRKYSSKGSLPEQGVKAVDFYGDLFFYSPAVQSLNMHAFNYHKTTQFQYMSRRRSALSPSLEYFPWFKGAGHGSELLFLFPVKYNVTIPADDISLSLTMMKYWSNFAKTGYVLYYIN